MTELYKVMARVVSQKGTCEAGLKVGDEFPVGEKTPANVCSFAYTAIFPFAVALMTGGSFAWEKDPDRTTVACPDPDNPVIIELSRIYP
jgi:uncharacterized repeat protein (TIGR04076 family)